MRRLLSHFLSNAQQGWPVVLIATVAAVAYFHARGMTQLISAELSAPAQAKRFVPPKRPTKKAVDATPILERNPFDSITGPLGGAPEPLASEAPQNPAAAPTKKAEKCDFGHVTSIVSTGGPYSFASIKTKDGKSELARLGDAVQGHEIMRIGTQRVWLRDASARCQMRLGDPLKVRKRKRAKRRKRRRRRRRRRRSNRRLPKHLANKINKVGENEYRVERSALNEILEKQTQLMGRTRVRPYKRGGKVIGVRLSRVRSGTLLHTLGLKSGDVLKSINGFDMTNPQKALEAYGRLGNADNLKVQIERGRKPMTIDFHIQ